MFIIVIIYINKKFIRWCNLGVYMNQIDIQGTVPSDSFRRWRITHPSPLRINGCLKGSRAPLVSTWRRPPTVWLFIRACDVSIRTRYRILKQKTLLDAHKTIHEVNRRFIIQVTPDYKVSTVLWSSKKVKSKNIKVRFHHGAVAIIFKINKRVYINIYKRFNISNIDKSRTTALIYIMDTSNVGYDMNVRRL